MQLNYEDTANVQVEKIREVFAADLRNLAQLQRQLFTIVFLTIVRCLSNSIPHVFLDITTAWRMTPGKHYVRRSRKTFCFVPHATRRELFFGLPDASIERVQQSLFANKNKTDRIQSDKICNVFFRATTS